MKTLACSLVLVLIFTTRCLSHDCVLNTDLRPLPWERSSDSATFSADSDMSLTSHCTANAFLPSDDGECDTCWNGVNAGEDASQTCDLRLNETSTQSYFWDKCCQYVNISVPTLQVNKRTLSVIWDADSILNVNKTYSFLFWEQSIPSTRYKRRPTICSQREALLAELESGKVEYTVCVLPEDVAESLACNSTRVERADCVVVVTAESEREKEYVVFVVVLTLMCVSVGTTFLLKFLLPVINTTRNKNKVRDSNQSLQRAI